jgi:hypothetical protein
MDELLDVFCTKYYSVGINFKGKNDDTWIGEATLIRKDTGEAVLGGCIRCNKDKNKVRKGIIDHLRGISKMLHTAPSGWNSSVLMVLSQKTRLNRMAMDLALYIEKNISTGIETEVLGEKFFDFYKNVTKETISIASKIDKMSSQERIELLTSKNMVYKNCDDPWNADDLIARYEIFSYFINSSSEERKAHKSHCLRCDDIIEEIENEADQ